jgi:hypothetical protein
MARHFEGSSSDQMLKIRFNSLLAKIWTTQEIHPTACEDLRWLLRACVYLFAESYEGSFEGIDGSTFNDSWVESDIIGLFYHIYSNDGIHLLDREGREETFDLIGKCLPLEKLIENISSLSTNCPNMLVDTELKVFYKMACELANKDLLNAFIPDLKRRKKKKIDNSVYYALAIEYLLKKLTQHPKNERYRRFFKWPEHVIEYFERWDGKKPYRSAAVEQAYLARERHNKLLLNAPEPYFDELRSKYQCSQRTLEARVKKVASNQDLSTLYQIVEEMEEEDIFPKLRNQEESKSRNSPHINKLQSILKID